MSIVWRSRVYCVMIVLLLCYVFVWVLLAYLFSIVCLLC